MINQQSGAASAALAAASEATKKAEDEAASSLFNVFSGLNSLLGSQHNPYESVTSVGTDHTGPLHQHHPTVTLPDPNGGIEIGSVITQELMQGPLLAGTHQHLLSAQQNNVHMQDFSHSIPGQSFGGQQQMYNQHNLQLENFTTPLLPTDHFLTVAHNGTVLGATKTILGIPSDSLLMTSVYDTVHHEDAIALRIIKVKYWDKGIPDIQICLRRKTIYGTWIWLECKVVKFIDSPVPGIILHECCARDENIAAISARMTLIASLLTQAVDDAEAWKLKQQNLDTSEENQNDVQSVDHTMGSSIPGLADDAAAIQSILANASSSLTLNNSKNLKRLIDAAARGGTILNENIFGESGDSNDNNKSDKTDESSHLLDRLTSGPSIAINQIRLKMAELKLIILVLKGQIQSADLPALVLDALNSPNPDLANPLKKFKLDCENHQKEELSSSSSRKQHSKCTPLTTRLMLGKNRGHQSSKSNSNYINPNHSTIQHIPIHTSSARNQTKQLDLSVGKSYNSYQTKTSMSSPKLPQERLSTPHICVINLSFTKIGNQGMEMLSEVLRNGVPMLIALDCSFCAIEERGILALSRSLRKRKKNKIKSLSVLVLTGNIISYKAAKELGLSLSPQPNSLRITQQVTRKKATTGYEEEDDELDDDLIYSNDSGRLKKDDEDGILLLHLGCTTLSSEGLYQLLLGLGHESKIEELNVASNNIGPEGVSSLVSFLEGKGLPKNKGRHIMSNLHRLDLSNNDLGNEGTAQLTRAISKKGHLSMVDLHLSFNNIGSGGIETIMNKLLQQNLVVLSLDNNIIGDTGCQLVAASLTSMHHLSKLNLSFNQIGSRGVTSLMRGLVRCESLNFLGLSGNVMKINGAIAMGFALAQHPRLAHLEIYNCCLSQVAQCHIIAGIISNRWVPMQKLYGFRAGPPMVAIEALDVLAQGLGNEECFSLRRNIQMKTILQWMESNRIAKLKGTGNSQRTSSDNFLKADFVSSTVDVNGEPSQSAYLRMLDWLSRIPFDEDELTDLRSYFYDADDGGDGLRGSDGQINLKHRGDLLAALGSGEVAKEIRNSHIVSEFPEGNAVGLEVDIESEEESFSIWKTSTDNTLPHYTKESNISSHGESSARVEASNNGSSIEKSTNNCDSKRKKRRHLETESSEDASFQTNSFQSIKRSERMSSQSMLSSSQHHHSCCSLLKKPSSINDELSSSKYQSEVRQNNTLKTRISMFPQFEVKLDLLKTTAQEMMDNEEDQNQQDIIAQQFAEHSLTLLRQLRYHCMNSGLDGWSKGKTRRKVLIVDDSVVTRKMVARAFEKANFIVDTAANGREGVEKMKESIYDIAFMDIDMPVMNGFDATKALREWEDTRRPGARQPICALTAAYVDDFERSELIKYKEAGLDVMESKPCNIPRLFKVVDDVSPMFSDLSISLTQLPERKSANAV